MIRGLPLLYSCRDKQFLIFSEYASDNVKDYQKHAIHTSRYVIGGVRSLRNVAIYIINPEGKILYKRYKYRHFGQEGLIKAEKPEIVHLDGFTILPLICFEMLFPEDWFNLPAAGVNFIVHLISSEMQNSHQAEGWEALHKVLQMRFYCDVVVVSGTKEEMGIPSPINPYPINLTKVLTWKPEPENQK